MARGLFRSSRSTRLLCWFFALQAADLLSTLIFRSMGVAETNPIAAYLMEHFGVFTGLLVLKSAAIAVGMGCNIGAHPTFLRRINMAYCAIIALNYLTICNALRA